MKNPIGFEFFKPPHEEFYEFLDAHLHDWSVEISVESHDDGVRAAFGKSHYTIEQVEKTDQRRAAQRLLALRPLLHDRHPHADRRRRCARPPST